MGSYDIENHMVQAGAAKYGYAPSGKRVWKAPDSNAAHEEFYFWTPAGQRLGIYKSTNPGTNAFTTASTNVYFAGRLIQAQSTAMVVDQLGSNVGNGKRYYPYGAERPSATTNNLEKFTGYYRDGETGLDYADQRYHEPGLGRFTAPDPDGHSAKLGDPGSWNRYSFVGGDPVNRTDPSGRACMSDFNGNYWDDPNGQAGQYGWISDDPCYTGGGYAGGDAGDGDAGSDGPVLTVGQTDEVTVSAQLDPAPTYTAPFCVNPSGCGASSPTLSDNWGVTGNYTYISPFFKGFSVDGTLIPGANSGVFPGETVVGIGGATGLPTSGFSTGLLFTLNGAPLAPILTGPSLTVSGILPFVPFGFGGTVTVSGSGIAVGLSVGSPGFNWSFGNGFCMFGCGP